MTQAPVPAKHADNPLLHAGTQFERLFAARSSLVPRDLSDAVVERRMMQDGRDTILELIAEGRLPNEIAFAMGLPVLKFRAALEKLYAPEEVKKAARIGAESLVLRAQTALTASPDNAAIGSMIRAYADLMMKLAERISADDWGPQKVADAAPPAVTINVMGNVPGLSALIQQDRTPTRLPTFDITPERV